MKHENLSQRKLLEILTHEIETLSVATKTIKQVVPSVEQHLRQIANTEMKANIDQNQIMEINRLFESFLNRLNHSVGNRIMFPKWLVWVLICTIIPSMFINGYLLYRLFFF